RPRRRRLRPDDGRQLGERRLQRHRSRWHHLPRLRGGLPERDGWRRGPVWVDPAVLIEQGVKQWTDLPLWRTHAGVWAVDSRRAVAAALEWPIADTVRDTWKWWAADGRPVAHPRRAEHGIAAEKEAKILASV